MKDIFEVTKRIEYPCGAEETETYYFTTEESRDEFLKETKENEAIVSCDTVKGEILDEDGVEIIAITI